MVQIIPAILATTEEDFARDISRLKHSLLFKEGWVHIDLMDNLFVPNGSIRPPAVAKYYTNLHKEAHLMVAHPSEWIDDLANAGFKRIIFHIEAGGDLNGCIDKIKSKGLEVGLAIKNETPIEKLEPFLGELDTVLVMSVVPGFQGQKFIPEALEKIKQLKSRQLTVKVGVDGAVKDDNIKEIVEAGVDFVAVGSYLLKGDIDENLERLWETLRPRSG